MTAGDVAAGSGRGLGRGPPEAAGLSALHGTALSPHRQPEAQCQCCCYARFADEEMEARRKLTTCLHPHSRDHNIFLCWCWDHTFRTLI